MSADTLREYVFRRMPIRARVLGRERLGEIVDLAVARWPAYELLSCGRGSSQEEEVLQSLMQEVSVRCSATAAKQQTYGFVWMFLMSAVVSAVVQAVLRWWLESSANRAMLRVWQQEGMK
jgi:hypothetical protein